MVCSLHSACFILAVLKMAPSALGFRSFLNWVHQRRTWLSFLEFLGQGRIGSDCIIFHTWANHSGGQVEIMSSKHLSECRGEVNPQTKFVAILVWMLGSYPINTYCRNKWIIVSLASVYLRPNLRIQLQYFQTFKENCDQK